MVDQLDESDRGTWQRTFDFANDSTRRQDFTIELLPDNTQIQIRVEAVDGNPEPDVVVSEPGLLRSPIH